MNANRTGSRLPRVGLIVGGWMLLAALIGFINQLLHTLHEHLIDESYFAGHFIENEATRLIAGATMRDSHLRLNVDAHLLSYSGRESNAYGFRIVGEDATILASSNDAELVKLSPLTLRPSVYPDFWLRKITENWFDLAGGTKASLGDRTVWVEILTHGDPALFRYNWLAWAAARDVWLPLAPVLAATLLVIWIVVRRKLKPLVLVAERVSSITNRDDLHDIPTAGLPREVAILVTTINCLLTRIAAMLKSQDQFVSCISHELRSRLAILLLEVNKIGGPSARRLEVDISEMSTAVSNLLSVFQFARPDAPQQQSELVDPVEIGRAVTSHLQPLIDKHSATLTITEQEPASFIGNPMAIFDAIRNLVENAIKHNPDPPVVKITCGPGRSITVEDDGPGLNTSDPNHLFEPFVRGHTHSEGTGLGLTVVKAAVERHHGVIEIDRSPMGGLRFAIRFNVHGDSEALQMLNSDGTIRTGSSAANVTRHA